MNNLLARHVRLRSALATAVDFYDDATARHSERVAGSVAAMAEDSGWSAADGAVAHWAGVLHDIGKIAVPDQVLRKRARLSDPEWDLVRQHPTVGADLLLAISATLAPVAEVIRSHHERWDGAGYPLGLAGDDIPPLARTLAVVDAFDAMTAGRPYQSALPIHAACDELQAGSGSQFDPDVVARFVELCR